MLLKYGDIKSCKLEVDEKGNSKGLGYITFYSPEAAHNCIGDLNGQDIKGSRIEIIDLIASNADCNNAVYMKHLPLNFDEPSLRDLLSTYGELSSIKMCNKDGKFTGAAIVSFSDFRSASAAVKDLNYKGTTFPGQLPLYVSFLQKKEERNQAVNMKNLISYKNKVMLSRNTEPITLLARLMEANIFSNQEEFEKSLRLFMKVVMLSEFNPVSIQVNFTNSTAVILVKNLKEANAFLEKYQRLPKPEFFIEMHNKTQPPIMGMGMMDNQFPGMNNIGNSMYQEAREMRNDPFLNRFEMMHVNNDMRGDMKEMREGFNNPRENRENPHIMGFESQLPNNGPSENFNHIVKNNNLPYYSNNVNQTNPIKQNIMQHNQQTHYNQPRIMNNFTENQNHINSTPNNHQIQPIQSNPITNEKNDFTTINNARVQNVGNNIQFQRTIPQNIQNNYERIPQVNNNMNGPFNQNTHQPNQHKPNQNNQYIINNNVQKNMNHSNMKQNNIIREQGNNNNNATHINKFNNNQNPNQHFNHNNKVSHDRQNQNIMNMNNQMMINNNKPSINPNINKMNNNFNNNMNPNVKINNSNSNLYNNMNMNKQLPQNINHNNSHNNHNLKNPQFNPNPNQMMINNSHMQNLNNLNNMHNNNTIKINGHGPQNHNMLNKMNNMINNPIHKNGFMNNNVNNMNNNSNIITSIPTLYNNYNKQLIENEKRLFDKENDYQSNIGNKIELNFNEERIKEMNHDELGNEIYDIVMTVHENEASKITGMIIDLGDNKMRHLLLNTMELKNVIDTAYQVS